MKLAYRMHRNHITSLDYTVLFWIQEGNASDPEESALDSAHPMVYHSTPNSDNW